MIEGTPNASAERICQLMVLPNKGKIYVIGCFDKRITIHSQQIKAINLAWALFKTNSVKKDDFIGIVGGGIAGLTVAAALVTLGCKVLIFEKKSQLLPFQQGNHTRYIHPNIYDWPHGDYTREATELPFFNWISGNPDNIHHAIKDQWESFVAANSDRVTIFMKSKMISSRETDQGVEVEYRKESEIRQTEICDVLIYAGGFGVERSIGSDIKTVPYWDDDDLHQLSKRDQEKKVAIIGCGDGGLIDYLRATLRDFKDGAYIYDFSRIPEALSLGQQMADIDAVVEKMVGDAVFKTAYDREEFESNTLYAAYLEKIKISRDLIARVKSKIRTDTKVAVFINTSTPFRLSTSRLNRLLVFILYHRLGRSKSDFRNSKYMPYESLQKIGFTIYPRMGTDKVVYEDLNIEKTEQIERIAQDLDRFDIGKTKYWLADDFFRPEFASDHSEMKLEKIISIDHNRSGYTHTDIQCEFIHEQFYLSFPEIEQTTLYNKNEYQKNDIISNGFEKKISPELLPSIEKQRRIVAAMFIQSQEKDARPLHNGAKYGIFSFQITPHHNTLHLRFYKTDYFTHLVMRRVYKELCERKDLFQSMSSDDFRANFLTYNFLNTSLGLYILLEINEGIVLLKRSKHVSNPEESKWHISVDTGFRPEHTSENGESAIQTFSYRSLLAELGLYKSIIEERKLDNLKFYDLILDRKRYEIILTAHLKLNISFNDLKMFYSDSRSGKGYETTEIRVVPLIRHELDKVIANEIDYTDALRFAIEKVLVRKGLLK